MDRAFALPKRTRDGVGWRVSDLIGNPVLLPESPHDT